jgi:diguanylate cyclase (GGDEF)-like protein
MADSGPHVLLVDDDPVVRRLVRALLRSDGYEVSEAPDGRQAVTLIEATAPDILVTDWMMPGLSGLDVCRLAREMRLPHYLYIVLLTARSASADLMQGMQAGADDFVNKGALRDELLPRLRAGRRVLELERRLTALAATDPLTGLTARRAFLSASECELERARRHALPLSCVMLDVDYFKRVNDVHGHAAGDAVLAAVGAQVRQCSRPEDLLCRYGGEELCALLPHADETAAAAWAERVREAISALRVPWQPEPLSVTASFGVAELLDDVDKPARMIDLADQALLVAKQSGRNRVVRYGALAAAGGEVAATALAGLRARDIMNPLAVCLRANETVRQASELLLQSRLNAAPVIDEQGKLVGVVSERDLLPLVSAPDAWQKAVGEVMKSNVVAYDEQSPAGAIHDFLCRVSLRRVVVVREGFPVGIVSRASFLRWQAAREAKAEAARGPTAGPAAAGAASLAAALSARAAALQRRLRDCGTDESAGPLLIGEVSQLQELLAELLADAGRGTGPAEFAGAAALADAAPAEGYPA